jgi:glycosyltransferase involved in cell wall biosynthesis
MITPSLVSVVITVFNREAMLRQAVASALDQSYRPIEIFIVDDGSSDVTPAVADHLASLHREVTVIHQANRGPGLAREAGRARVRGEFVQYLDSDDLLERHKFEEQVAGLLQHPECGASYGWTRLRRADGSADPLPVKRTGERIETMFPAFLQSRWWDTSTPLFRRRTTDAAGAWLSLRAEEDWEYDARVASLGTRLHYCPTLVSETRQLDPGRASTNRGPSVFRDRADAHARIYAHAVRAGISSDTPEMIHFARELFLLARQCGAAGLASDSERLFALAREASGSDRDRLQFRAYHALARMIGWSGAGKLATMSDHLRWRARDPER